MLVAVPDRAAVTACSTCRFTAAARDDDEGRRGGARLLEALRTVQAEGGHDDVAVREMPCLFACTEHCTVHLSAPGKVGYVMGRFTPDEDTARAILDYARAYADSDWGQVPYRDWPEGVKGHFITRQPPAGFVVA